MSKFDTFYAILGVIILGMLGYAYLIPRDNNQIFVCDDGRFTLTNYVSNGQSESLVWQNRYDDFSLIYTTTEDTQVFMKAIATVPLFETSTDEIFFNKLDSKLTYLITYSNGARESYVYQCSLQ